MTISRPPVVVGASGAQPTLFRYAIAEAGRHRTSLRVVHCHESPADAAAAEQVLADAQAAIEEQTVACDVTYAVIAGATKGVLLAEADGAEALVLGADDGQWFDRMVGCALARSVAHSAICPVVVVPERSADVAQGGAVVVTVDGDTSAAGPLSYGFDQAEKRGEVLVVLHAVPVGTERADFDSHRANVAEVIAGWNAFFPDVHVLVSSTIGDPVDLSISATTSASLVVIGRPHGRNRSFALARPVAMQVLRQAQCPVAVVPNDYRRDRVNGSTRAGRRSPVVSWR